MQLHKKIATIDSIVYICNVVKSILLKFSFMKMLNSYVKSYLCINVALCYMLYPKTI